MTISAAGVYKFVIFDLMTYKHTTNHVNNKPEKIIKQFTIYRKLVHLSLFFCLALFSLFFVFALSKVRSSISLTMQLTSVFFC